MSFSGRGYFQVGVILLELRFYKDILRLGAISFDEISFIAAFCRCAKGFEDGLPVHYPRINRPIDPEGKNDDWFTDNEAGEGFSLPSLVTRDSLPLNPRPDSKASNTNNKALQR